MGSYSTKKMLRSGLYALACLTLASCSERLGDGLFNRDDSVETQIYVSMDETKTVNEGMSTKWTGGDKLSVIYKAKYGTGYRNAEFEYKSSESDSYFRGRLQNPESADALSYYAVYPYSEDRLSPADVNITVSKNPVQAGNNSTAHLAGENFPLYGKKLNVPWGSDISIAMQNVLSIADFNITNGTDKAIKVKSIEFTSADYIVGPFSANLTMDEVEWTSNEESSHKVVLSVKDGDEIAATKTAHFYAGVLPHACNAGSSLKMKVTATVDSKDVVFYKKFDLTKQMYFTAGFTKNVKATFDTEHQEDPWPESENLDGKEEDDTEKYYYKVTSTPSSWEGTYLIVDEKASVAFSEGLVNYATPIEIKNGKIEAIPALIEDQVKVTTSSKGDGKYDVKTISGKYIYSYASEILYDSNVSNNHQYFNTFSLSEGKVFMSSAWSTSQKRLTYTGGMFTYVDDESSVWDSATVSLFRLGKADGEDEPEDPNKDNQSLSFSSSEVNWTLGDGYSIGSSYSPQSVSGAKTDVTWSSSNENVASISGSKILINAAGTTIITAKAAESDKYNSASASYTLNIKSSSSEQGSSVYTKVTSEPSSWDGTYLVVNESAGKAFAPFTGNASSYAVSVSISNNQIVSDGNIDKYAITVSSAGEKHDNDNVSDLDAYNVKNSDGQYIWWSSNFGEYDSARLIASNTNTATNDSKEYTYYHTFKYSSGVQMTSAIHTGSGSAYYLGYSSSAFSYEKSEDGNRVQLYKLSGSTSGKQNQTISFSKSSVSWSLGSSYEIGSTYSIQSLSGTYYTSVTYTSSEPSVATIEGNNIKIQGTGTTIIKATAASSSEYNSATAEYTLTIKSSSSTVSGYELVTSAPNDWSGTYLLVNPDKDYLFNGEKTSNKVALSSSDFNGNVITNTSYSQYAFTVSKSGDSYYFKKGSNYYGVDYGSNSSTGIITSTSKTGMEWTYDGALSGNAYKFYMYDSDQKKDMYIYYKSSSENRFKFGNSGKDIGILMYRLNDGGTIDDGDDEEEDEPQTGDYFVKVTSEPSSWAGTYLVVDDSAGKAFAYNSSSSYATSVSISNGKIAWTSSLDEIALRISDAGLNHPNTQMASDISYSGSLRAYNVKTKAGKYIYSSQSEIQVSDSNESSGSSSGSAYYHAFRYSDGGVYMFSSKDYTSSSYMGYYYCFSYSSSKFAYGSKGELAKCQLYKLNGESGGSTGGDVTPSGTSFNLENSYLKQYLDAAATSYTNSTTKSIVATYSGSSSARDLPAPVSLSWSGSASSISIYEGTSTSGTAVKTISLSSATSVDVYNLIPGKNYSYKTSNGQTGTFNTTGRRRMIKVSSSESQNHGRNCRDLGGISTRDGKTLKYGLIFRGTNLDSVTDEEKKILVNDLGIKLEQDLRGASKSAIGVSISGEEYSSTSIANQNGSNMKTTVSDVLNSVIDNKPVYIHCAIGSDRTGHMCMLYLALLGVELKECDIDYEITSFASKMTYGTRTIGSGNEEYFRDKFVKSPYSVDTVPEAVEDYVTNTLNIPLDTVKKFRKAMGASESL